jgi:hypothetical protein
LDYGKLGVFPPAQVNFLGGHYSVLGYEIKCEGVGHSRDVSTETHNSQLTLRDGLMCLTIYYCQG